ncbi:MAG: ABC transporter permease [Candidatus Promineifilaceae bacterium]
MGRLLIAGLRRLAAVAASLLIISAVLFGIFMLAPAEERAELYLPPNSPPLLDPAIAARRLEAIIERHGLRDPYPQQYFRWLGRMLSGDWGWSPVLQGEVLPALIRRTPVTAELTLYSVLVYFPLGVAAGVLSGWRRHSRGDNLFRLLAFVGTSIPLFILGLFLLSIFYVGLNWFPPGRTGIVEVTLQTAGSFERHTGLLTLDGLLNGRPDVTLDALRHLALPVFTLSLAHWATLGRITRAAIIEEQDKDYITVARARGLRPSSIKWRHALGNVLSPVLASGMLSAAALVSGVFVVEAIFNFHGLSELLTRSARGAPDVPLALGFAVYSVLLVLGVMVALDGLRGLADPRSRV